MSWGGLTFAEFSDDGNGNKTGRTVEVMPFQEKPAANEYNRYRISEFIGNNETAALYTRSALFGSNESYATTGFTLVQNSVSMGMSLHADGNRISFDVQAFENIVAVHAEDFSYQTPGGFWISNYAQRAIELKDGTIIEATNFWVENEANYHVEQDDGKDEKWVQELTGRVFVGLQFSFDTIPADLSALIPAEYGFVNSFDKYAETVATMHTIFNAYTITAIDQIKNTTVNLANINTIISGSITFLGTKGTGFPA